MMNSTEEPAVRKGSVLLTRMESITEYKNQHGQNGPGTQEQPDTPVSANDMCALEEWPSHARRNRALLQNETDGQKKKGRGVLKGYKASKKRFANGSVKLSIAFSETLGGTIGMHYRSFTDDVVVIMKRKLPLIGVRWWSDIHPSIHRLIVADMIDRWDLEDTPETEEKILKIAQERYRGWRATLHSTYKAYKTDAARLANVPEDLQPEEWEWFMEYVATDSKFQQRSQKNSDNSKKQKTKHRIGSKSYSQISFEKRDLETEEEPDCVALWELTHTKNGAWSNKDSQDVYEKACQEVQNKEKESQGPVSSEQRSHIFHTAYKETLKCKSSQPRGYGYMAKPSSGSERFRSQFEEQAREFQKKNVELCQHVTELQDQLQAERESTQERINLERAKREILEEKLEQERADRERLLEEERRSRKEFEKNMIEKFAKMSQMFETQQITKKRNAKENSNPNLQSTPSRTPSKSGTIGTRQSLIAPNMLIQASTKNSRIFRALTAMEAAGKGGIRVQLLAWY